MSIVSEEVTRRAGKPSGAWRSRWAAVGAAVAVTLGAATSPVTAASSEAASFVGVEPTRILDTRSDVGLKAPPAALPNVAAADRHDVHDDDPSVRIESIPIPTQAAGPPARASYYQPITPIRIIDTRDSNVDALKADDITYVAAVTGEVAAAAGVDARDVTAVAMHATVTQTSGKGFLTVYPAGTERPLASTLNWMYSNHTIGNLAAVPVDSGGNIEVYSLQETQLIIDIQGVFVEGNESAAGRLMLSSTPTRIHDSRLQGATAKSDNKYGAIETTGPLKGDSTTTVDVGAVVPEDASAVVVNVTTTRSAQRGYVTLFADGVDRPIASNLNFSLQGAVASQAYVALNDAKFDLYVSRSTDVVLDVAGYYTGTSAPVSSDGLFVPVQPFRMLDTRESQNSPNNGTPLNTSSLTFATAGRGGVEPTASAISANLTLTRTSGPGWVKAWAAGLASPNTSSVNASYAGHTVANHAVTALGSSGNISVSSSALTHVIFDVSGYFTGQGEIPETDIPADSPGQTVGEYAFLFNVPDADGNERPVFWDPCTPIRYVTNFDLASNAQRQMFPVALAQFEAATGLEFVDVGTFDGGAGGFPDLPENSPGGFPPDDFAVFFGVYPTASGAIEGAGGRAGVAGGTYGVEDWRDGFWITRGYAAQASDQWWVNSPFVTLTIWLHELGHLGGLAHVDSDEEVMYPTSNRDDYGPGDLRGLELAGTTANSCALGNFNHDAGADGERLRNESAPEKFIIVE